MRDLTSFSSTCVAALDEHTAHGQRELWQPLAQPHQVLDAEFEPQVRAVFARHANRTVRRQLGPGQRGAHAIELDFLVRRSHTPTERQCLGRHPVDTEYLRDAGRICDQDFEPQVRAGQPETSKRSVRFRRDVAEFRIDIELGELVGVREPGVDVQRARCDDWQPQVLEHFPEVRMLELQGQIRARQRIELAETAIDVELQSFDRALDVQSDVPSSEECVDRPHVSVQHARVAVETSFPGDGQEPVGPRFDGQRLNERDAVRLPGLAIRDFDVAELAVQDDRRNFGGGRVGRSFLFCFATEFPVGLAVLVLLEKNRDVAQLERTNVHGPRNQRPQPDVCRDAPDLDHLRLRAPFGVAEADAFGEDTDRRKQLELERPIDRERSADLFRDQGFDAAFVSTQVGQTEVKHDREEQSSHDGERDDNETAK